MNSLHYLVLHVNYTGFSYTYLSSQGKYSFLVFFFFPIWIWNTHKQVNMMGLNLHFWKIPFCGLTFLTCLCVIRACISFFWGSIFFLIKSLCSKIMKLSLTFENIPLAYHSGIKKTWNCFCLCLLTQDNKKLISF